MSGKNGSRELIWAGVGVLALLIAFFTLLYPRGRGDLATQIADKEKRVALVHSMRMALAAASEAQNSAVMALREEDSKSFINEARQATAALERGQAELEKLLKERGNSHEAELLQRFAQVLGEFQQVDKQLLDLAAQNSNRKAYHLAFGPATELLKEIDEPLSHISADQPQSSSENRLRVVQLTSDVRLGILRMQVLLLPHIAEPTDQKMDEFEAQLSEEDRKIRENFASLSALLPETDKSRIDTAISRYAEFEKLKSQIVTLSRQNTDLKAAQIAVKEKRKAMLDCQDALVALEHEIQAEPVTSPIPTGRSP